MKRIALAVALGVFVAAPAAEAAWCKSVTHVHSWWSDGNAHPEMIALRYLKAGYCLVVFSEHNKLATFDMAGALPTTDQWASNGWARARPHIDGGNAYLVEYLDAAGADRVVYDAAGDGSILVPSFASTKRWIEGLDAGLFLVPGMEMTANTSAGGFIHLNVWEIATPVTVTDGGANVATVIDVHVKRARDAGVAPEAGVAQPIVVLNHPKWSSAGVIAVTDWRAQDIQFVEIQSGLDAAQNRGASGLTSATRDWDLANWYRQGNGLPYIWGLGNDDAHHYWGDQPDGSCLSPECATSGQFRAWAVIRHDGVYNQAELVTNLLAGDFYVSSGASLTDFSYSGGCMTITPSGANDRVKIYGIRRADGTTQMIKTGRGAQTSCPNPTDYAFARAEVIDAAGKRAWTQPMDL